MFKYGFELEGYYRNAANEIVIPPNTYPTDSFPGLVELRTNGGENLWDQGMYCLQKYIRGFMKNVDFSTHCYRFPRSMLVSIRERSQGKQPLTICNLYGKHPRDLKGLSIASFQINISNLIRAAYITKEGTIIPANYALLNIPNIIRNFDETF